MVKDSVAPTHVVGAVGVTLTVAVIGLEVAFVAVKLGVEPVPEADKPIEVVELVHANVEPATVEVNV
jgi:hypothetical protein